MPRLDTTSATGTAFATKADTGAKSYPIATGPEPLLAVQKLGISFVNRDGEVPVTRDVSFHVRPGERVGMVGESGCGKTVTGLAMLGLLPQRSTRIHGNVLFEGRDLARLSAREMRRVRGRHISMIFQEPMSALDPVFTVGQQLVEAVLAHESVSRREARERVLQALVDVGIPLPERRIDEYPHQFSGGMLQRVVIAMALICRPQLIIADEPTTALDVTVQAQIIDLLCRLSEDTGTALLFITHDLGVVAETCTRMLTMYAGEIVEDAPVEKVLKRPRHPYSSGLLRSLPRLSARGEPLPSIPGRVPSPGSMPTGCRFRSRCPHVIRGCEQDQPLQKDADRLVRCWRHDELELPGVLD